MKIIITSSRQKQIAILFWVAAFLLMGAIFYMSSQNGRMSNSLSKGIISDIKPYVNINSINEKNDFIHQISFNFLLRKLTHFTEYFVLSFLLFGALFFNKATDGKALVNTFIICFLFAVSDEIHQIFVTGRTPRVYDIIIDSGGALLAGVICYKKLSGKVSQFMFKNSGATS